MAIDPKHIDFEVPGWAEADQGPGTVGFVLRPAVLRPLELRPSSIRPDGSVEAVAGLQTVRPVGLRPVNLRPGVIRPTIGSGVTVIYQDLAGAFPDRPIGGGGTGMLVSLVSGIGGQNIQHGVLGAADVLHARVLVNLGTATGGSVAVMRGVDVLDREIWSVWLDPDMGVVTVNLGTGQSLTATFVASIPWHCVELGIDTVGGTAGLWINGVNLDQISGPMGLLVTACVQLGGVFKDQDATGQLYLDEWKMDSSYIGPVTIDPVSPYADDPARWLVIYNRDVADSVAWAESYRQARGVPLANLVGLSLDTAEVINSSDYSVLRAAIQEYLTENHPDDQVMGILLGYRVPGYVDLAGIGVLDSIAALLYDLGTVPGFNPLAADGVPIRPTKSNVAGMRLTARIDGADLTQSQAIVNRASTLITNGVGDGAKTTIWLDPYTTPGSVIDPHIASMVNWASSVDRMRTRLPLELSADSDPQQEVQFDQIQDDGFFWGWAQPTPPVNFFAASGGDRVFCFQLEHVNATAPTVRSVSASNWLEAALDAGYAAAAGSGRQFSSTAIPFVRPFFEALRQGWTLAEAWFVSLHAPGEGLFLLGDPLMTVRLPQAGWDIFGPLDRLEDIKPDTPALAVRDDELSVGLSSALQPSIGSESVYLIRHVDVAGRSEAGTSVVRVVNLNNQAAVPPLRPIWPDVDGWPVWVEDRLVMLTLVWDRPVRDCRVETVELHGQVDGVASQVLEVFSPDPLERQLQTQRPLPAISARYHWRIRAANGAEFDTPWSAIVKPVVSSTVLLQPVEVLP